MANRSADINVIFRAASKAARAIARDFGEVENLQVSKKGPADFVTNTDIKAEEILREELERSRPAYGILGEEGSSKEGDDPLGKRWVIDPIDGTTNFMHGIPHFAISIGVEERGTIVSGAIYEPLRDEFFWAERGAGAYLNDRRIRVSGRRRIEESLFATGAPFKGHGDIELFSKQAANVMAQSAGIRRMGSASLDLAYVAAGRCEGYWEHGLHPWDIAAGIIIVKEAGGYVSDFKGKDKSMENGEIVAANDHLHGTLLKLIKV